jgi:putative heme-binding domain-containing protein
MLSRVACILVLSLPADSDWIVPEGFVVREYSDHSLAPDITCMTIDPTGRVIVAGRGYIRWLQESADGRVVRAIDLVSVKEAAMGLLAEGDSLYAVVDGGLWRWSLDPQHRKATGPPEKLVNLRTSGEHHAHAVHRGPDGWLYVIVGDGTGIRRNFVTSDRSPILEPIGGCLLRLSPDGTRREIVADGFRNAYDFSFDADGFPWTFDSDNERCVGLPWYEPTRVYRILPGAHHGWRGPQRSETWRLPPYYLDVSAPETTCGRGSPTGVVWHNHPHWPAEFQGLFLADWTFGTIWLFRPQPGAQPLPFLKPRGEMGFAPTALAVHRQTGELFVSVGGRGTRGAVYRVTPRTRGHDTTIRWPTPAWAVTVRQLVERRVSPAKPTADDLQFAWDAVSRSGHRSVTWAAAELVSRATTEQQVDLLARSTTPRHWIVSGLAIARRDSARAITLALRAFEDASASASDRQDAVRLMQIACGELTATAHRATVWAGYTLYDEPPADATRKIRQVLKQAFPTGERQLDREISRTLALLADPDVELARKIVAQLRFDSDPIDDIHYLIVLSRLPVSWDRALRQRVADAMLAIDQKLARLGHRQDRNWPLRMLELHAELVRRDSSLNQALVDHPDFGRPEHGLWTRHHQFDRKSAAKRFLRASLNEPNWAWSAETLSLLAELPRDAWLPIVRRLAHTGGPHDAIIALLARNPHIDDLEIFRQGLTSTRLDVVQLAIESLHQLRANDAKTIAALIRAERRLPTGKEGEALRQALVETLTDQTGMKWGRDFGKWAEWFAQTYPELASIVKEIEGSDWSTWQKRLAKIDWNAADPERGRVIFLTKAQCSACHSGAQALGPDLSGIGQRFSRADRFLAIVQPDRDVPSRYRTVEIETKDGRTHRGLIVYEAADGLILQTGAAATIRLNPTQIDARRVTDRSLMPSGLLDPLTDQEIADLDAYLRSLK